MLQCILKSFRFNYHHIDRSQHSKYLEDFNVCCPSEAHSVCPAAHNKPCFNELTLEEMFCWWWATFALITKNLAVILGVARSWIFFTQQHQSTTWGPGVSQGMDRGHLVGLGGIRRIELYAGDFSGERWSSHSAGRVCSVSHEKFRQHLQELGGLATPHLSQPTVYQSNPCILCPLILLQLSCYFTVITHEIKDLSFKYGITSSVIAETYGRRGL